MATRCSSGTARRQRTSSASSKQVSGSLLQESLKQEACSEAVRTNPPNFPGIYFADLFSKSYNYTQSYGYCPWQYQNQGKKIPKKYMLLCEVALGNSNELKTSKVVKNIPNSKHQSVKGVGNAGPDFAKSIYLANGCMVPVGNLITYPTFKSKNHYYGGLQHNEYVVYDTTQVRIKYVVELRQK